eukprot:gnl/TRDRNA2_/TRDRNA2_38721_c0_seq1.p1 gnl/TRDRNA2_/TRDRNA2_38721_c0~~gnl/TRDRNA2_/TRDRNA2_38721_c0_seq1.p1  ORF type:complete len:339 (+),score=41.88 gnl/TRDRNA2_/TRDRNA2_38721_c0_seq1:122-1138(+)
MPEHPKTRLFHSQAEIVGYWHQLMASRDGKDIPTGLPTRFGADELDLIFVPEGDPSHEYVATLATPDDFPAISALGDEFVRTHSALFADEYRGVDHETWCHYLGLHSDAALRKQVFLECAQRNCSSLSRTNTLGMSLCQSGCTLKLVCHSTSAASARASTAARARQSAAPLPSARGKGHGSESTSHQRVVGYVHFSMEEGTPANAPRSSKRLKRKRGEQTGEYIKVSHLIITKAYRGRGLGAFMLVAMLHRVFHIDRAYTREVFLTVIERNTYATGLYQRLGLGVLGRNTTFLGKGRTRPVSWCQMSADTAAIAGRMAKGGREEQSDDSSTPSVASDG